MAENVIKIGGRLHSSAQGNVLAGANEIYDDEKQKKQSVINAEVDEAIADLQEGMPTKISDLPNDSGYQTSSQVDAKVAAAAVNDVNVSVDNTAPAGQPSAERTFQGGVLDITFKNVKGEKGDALTWDDLNDEQKALLKGKQGDSAVFDPETGNILATLHDGIGADTANSMTQNGITREVLPIKNDPAMRVEGVANGYLTNTGKVNSSSTYMVTDYVMLEEGQTKLYIVSGVWKPSSYSQVCFYSEPNEESFVDKINEGTASTEITNVDYDIPSTARYCRFTVKDVEAIISVKGSLVKRIEDIESNAADIEEDVAEVKQTQVENTKTLEKVVDMFDINISTTPCAEGKDGKLLAYTTANGHQEKTVSGKGITDFIPVTGGSSVLLVSGFYQGTGTEYRLAEFYSQASMGNEVGTGFRTTTMGAISNLRIAVPDGASYMRLSLASKDTAGIVDMSVDFDVEEVKADIEELKANQHRVFGQVKNNPLPIKATTEEMNVLLIGSSYGVDSIDALADIGIAAGVKINTWNMYKSGGSVAQYLAQIESGATEITYYHDSDGTKGYYNKTVLQAVTGKAWDVIVLMNSANDSYNIVDGINEDFAKWVAYIKENCTNPRVVLALNSTWTAKARKAEQGKIYQVTCDLMRQTGIDLVIPNGAAITMLQETYGDDVYRDAEHLNAGIGRFTTGCTLYYATAYYVFGIPLTANLDITGYWGNPSLTEQSAILVSSENRAVCLECAKKANANRFLMAAE